MFPYDSPLKSQKTKGSKGKMGGNSSSIISENIFHKI